MDSPKNNLKKQKNKIVYNWTENTKTQSQIKTAEKLKAKDILATNERNRCFSASHKQQSFLIIFGKMVPN